MSILKVDNDTDNSNINIYLLIAGQKTVFYSRTLMLIINGHIHLDYLHVDYCSRLSCYHVLVGVTSRLNIKKK